MSVRDQRNRIRSMRERRLGLVIVAAFLFFLAFILWNWIETCYRRRQLFDLYFPATVQGLSVGANVIIDGRKIGQVESIRLRSLSPDVANRNYAVVTVYADLRELWNLPGTLNDMDYRRIIESQVDCGLRSRLRLPSLISDGLCVEFFYDRKKPAFFVNDPQCENIEIPTYSSSFSQYIDQINAKIEQYQLRELSEKLLNAENYVRHLNAVVRQIDFDKLNHALVSKTEAIQKQLDAGQFGEKLANLNAALTNFSKKLEDGNQDCEVLFKNTSQKLVELLGGLKGLQLTLNNPKALSPEHLSELENALNRCSTLLRQVGDELRKYVPDESKD